MTTQKMGTDLILEVLQHFDDNEHDIIRQIVPLAMSENKHSELFGVTFENTELSFDLLCKIFNCPASTSTKHRVHYMRRIEKMLNRNKLGLPKKLFYAKIGGRTRRSELVFENFKQFIMASAEMPGKTVRFFSAKCVTIIFQILSNFIYEQLDYRIQKQKTRFGKIRYICNNSVHDFILTMGHDTSDIDLRPLYGLLYATGFASRGGRQYNMLHKAYINPGQHSYAKPIIKQFFDQQCQKMGESPCLFV